MTFNLSLLGALRYLDQPPVLTAGSTKADMLAFVMNANPQRETALFQALDSVFMALNWPAVWYAEQLHYYTEGPLYDEAIIYVFFIWGLIGVVLRQLSWDYRHRRRVRARQD